jgi:hypothetical protein
LVYQHHGFRVPIKLDIDHGFDTKVVAKDNVLCGSEVWTLVKSKKKKNSYILKTKVNLHEFRKKSYQTLLYTTKLCSHFEPPRVEPFFIQK